MSVLQRVACSFLRAADNAAEGIKSTQYRWTIGEKTEALVEKYKLRFKVAYGSDARAVRSHRRVVNDDPTISRQLALPSIPKAGS